MTLEITSGATILGSGNPDDFPVVPPLPSYCQGREMPGPRYTSLLHGEHLENVVVTGGGTIDGQGKIWWDAHHSKKLNHTRPRLVEFMWVTGLTISNITMKNSPFWTLHPYTCNSVLISHVNIENPIGSPNTDGIDPDSSTNVVITDSKISSGDDHISIKSGWNYCGCQYARPAANILIQNVAFGVGAGIAIGSETSGGAHNITIRDSTVAFADNVVRFKTARGRGGVVSNVTYSNITFDGVVAAVSINMDYRKGPRTNSTGTPVITGLTITGLKGNAWQAGELTCLPESPCSLTLDDVDVRSIKGWKCENAIGTVGSAVTPALGSCLKNTTADFHVARRGGSGREHYLSGRQARPIVPK
eukprot:TRINITY_DN4855_c0_g1_i1.p1 TRINITY_DN4855_c0_g1~~TRINITY_DN4855_c0_g1_i1.p1  ORF type:complete len:360 (+),score=46.00 TRINITY_DN4855_c0_g1_i1:777-1856(+)